MHIVWNMISFVFDCRILKCMFIFYISSCFGGFHIILFWYFSNILIGKCFSSLCTYSRYSFLIFDFSKLKTEHPFQSWISCQKSCSLSSAVFSFFVVLARLLTGGLILSRKVDLCIWWSVPHSAPLITLVRVQSLLSHCRIINMVQHVQRHERGFSQVFLCFLLSWKQFIVIESSLLSPSCCSIFPNPRLPSTPSLSE